jgi:hypothetical protein
MAFYGWLHENDYQDLIKKMQHLKIINEKNEVKID